MDQGAPAFEDVFEHVRAILSRLGFKVTDETSPYAGRVEAVVRFGRKKLARLYVRAEADNVDLRVHSVDPASHGILAGSGRISRAERLEEELDSVEGLFRAWLVKSGKLDYAEFPTDRFLRTWLDKVSSLPVAGEKRTTFSVGIMAGVRIVRTARALAKGFDRAAAVRLHAYCAELDMNTFGPDAGRGFHLIHSSAAAADHRYVVAAQAWEHGSQGAYLVSGQKREHPDREPVAEAEATAGVPSP